MDAAPDLGRHADESMQQTRDLLPALWHAIFSLLDVDDVRMACQVCREWRAIGGDGLIWRKLSARVWPDRTLLSASYGGSFQRLVLHRNARNAVAALPLTPAASLWRYNSRRRAYYACRFLHLELQPKPTDTGPAFLRLYFDARGERDLRSPRQTSLVAVTLRDAKAPSPPPSGGGGGGGGGAQGGDAGGGAGAGGGVAVAAAAAALPPAPAALELGPDERRPLWQEIHACELPTACCMVSITAGHIKGCMEWTGPALHRLLRCLTDTRVSLLAVYACNVLRFPGDPYGTVHAPDYAPALLWGGGSGDHGSGRGGSGGAASGRGAGGGGGAAAGRRTAQVVVGPSFADGWRRRAEYHAPGELLQRLADEDDAAERARWATSLPPWVAARGRGWWAQGGREGHPTAIMAPPLFGGAGLVAAYEALFAPAEDEDVVVDEEADWGPGPGPGFGGDMAAEAAPAFLPEGQGAAGGAGGPQQLVAGPPARQQQQRLQGRPRFIWQQYEDAH